MQYLINCFVTAFVVCLLNFFVYFRSQPFHIRLLEDTLRHSVFNTQNGSSINIRSKASGHWEKYILKEINWVVSICCSDGPLWTLPNLQVAWKAVDVVRYWVAVKMQLASIVSSFETLCGALHWMPLGLRFKMKNPQVSVTGRSHISCCNRASDRSLVLRGRQSAFVAVKKPRP